MEHIQKSCLPGSHEIYRNFEKSDRIANENHPCYRFLLTRTKKDYLPKL
jgi:hypothetical protein